MRTTPIIHLDALFIAVFLGACGDLTAPAPTWYATDRAPGFTRAAAGEKTEYLYVEVKKNGRTKLYRVKISKGRKTIEFQTVAEEVANTSALSTCDDPTLPGCETNPENPTSGDGTGGGSGTGILTGELEIDGTVVDTVDTGEPWDPSYSAAGWDGTEYHCARQIEGMHFHWKNHYFHTDGVSYFVRTLPSSTAGVVKGRYVLPNGPWLSTDGLARIWSGTVDANCYFEYTNFAGIMLIEYGAVVVYRFNGDYEELGSDANFASNQGGEYGGTVYPSLDALRSGDPESYAVVKSYLDSGTCTDGWVIVIDGVRVC